VRLEQLKVESRLHIFHSLSTCRLPQPDSLYHPFDLPTPFIDVHTSPVDLLSPLGIER
jgi:hypothetical protein